jgi:hypothetical protein
MQSIDFKVLLSSSLYNSPSFSHNMLMYYVLILENVLRYETKLIKQSGFYRIYKRAVEEFFLSDKIELILKEFVYRKDN